MPWSSRKLLIVVLGMAAGSALAYLGKLDAATAALIGSLVSGYLASNVSQKVMAP
jgi:hypothetical protein